MGLMLASVSSLHIATPPPAAPCLSKVTARAASRRAVLPHWGISHRWCSSPLHLHLQLASPAATCSLAETPSASDLSPPTPFRRSPVAGDAQTARRRPVRPHPGADDRVAPQPAPVARSRVGRSTHEARAHRRARSVEALGRAQVQDQVCCVGALFEGGGCTALASASSVQGSACGLAHTCLCLWLVPVLTPAAVSANRSAQACACKLLRPWCLLDQNVGCTAECTFLTTEC